MQPHALQPAEMTRHFLLLPLVLLLGLYPIYKNSLGRSAPTRSALFLPLEFCSSFLHSRSLFCGTDRDIRCSCPNVQTSQLRPISGRSQFEVSEAPLFADVPHVGRQHGQHLLVGPAVLRPPGYGVNGKMQKCPSIRS